jgi:hypothetical protein
MRLAAGDHRHLLDLVARVAVMHRPFHVRVPFLVSFLFSTLCVFDSCTRRIWVGLN